MPFVLPWQADWIKNKVGAGKERQLSACQSTIEWKMKSSRKMDSINATALPIVPLDESMAVSIYARKELENAVRKQFQENPPSILLKAATHSQTKHT